MTTDIFQFDGWSVCSSKEGQYYRLHSFCGKFHRIDHRHFGAQSWCPRAIVWKSRNSRTSWHVQSASGLLCRTQITRNVRNIRTRIDDRLQFASTTRHNSDSFPYARILVVRCSVPRVCGTRCDYDVSLPTASTFRCDILIGQSKFCFPDLQNGLLLGNIGHGRRIHHWSHGRCLGAHNSSRFVVDIDQFGNFIKRHLHCGI